ncbi:HEAT repeat domain-containing protein [Oculatella sp. LEGE 06141]|uniref:phycobilisome degradation protein NblB n=1 Tax=Oculatella sp. LEGE 06141 TaxID=1828648 RepID=UPI0018801EDC|nr:HEAT repeat domain-containing protein [Oculatella sp. LEGE 06141]MBE9182093.1 HEAT repeat domain-containing protein [Oculatella sp. LEGE 06141]
MSVTPESVQQRLNSEDFGQRLSAVNQIRQLTPEDGFPLIRQAIADKSARVRYAAVSQMSSIGQHNSSVALEVLRRCLLEDPEPDVQAAAADSLGALKLTEAFDDLQHLYHQTSEWLVQFSIIAALGELGDERSFELLEAALNSDNELVKTAAIGSLGELGNPHAVPLLLPYISHSDWQIRYRLVQALSHFEGQEVRAALEALAQDETAAVAEEAKHHLSS